MFLRLGVHVVALTANRKQTNQFRLQRTGIYFNRMAQVLQGKPQYELPGEPVELWLPQMDASGKLDFAHAQKVTCPFATYLDVPTRTVSWLDGQSILHEETGLFKGDIAWVGEETWRDIMDQVGGSESFPLGLGPARRSASYR